MKTERALTRKEGLPRRPWYRHQIYAPGFYTGYGVKTLPGVREALEQRQWKEAEEQVGVVAGDHRRLRQGDRPRRGGAGDAVGTSSTASRRREGGLPPSPWLSPIPFT